MQPVSLLHVYTVHVGRGLSPLGVEEEPDGDSEEADGAYGEG